MNITILHNRITDNPSPDELDVLEQVRSVTHALKSLNHSVNTLPFDLDCTTAKQALLKRKPDRVFNLVESVDGYGALLHFAPALIETLQIPYTGCPADAIYLTSNKLLAKQLLSASGLMTPAWSYPARNNHNYSAVNGAGKWIIKSVWEHASVGLDESSVVVARNTAELCKAVQGKKEVYGGEWFAEQFIDGREFNIALLGRENGVEVLPPAEILFQQFTPDKPGIVDYRAKWVPDSPEYQNTPRSFDFLESDYPLLSKLQHIARQCWSLFHLRGYARVDVRVDEKSVPLILEINANPCLSLDAGYAAAVDRHGMSYSNAIQRILSDSVIPYHRDVSLQRNDSSEHCLANNAR
jgi:D-alanine-D-alanine ligase